MKRTLSFLLILCIALGGLWVLPNTDKPLIEEKFEIPEGTVGTRGTLHVGPSQTYSTIATAITAAIDGDTIRVHQQTYTERITIPSGKQLHLIGDGIGLTIIDGSNTDDVITINENGSTVKGFTVRNGGTGSDDAGILINSNWNLIEDVNVTDCGQGILIFGSNNTMENCTLYDSWYNGVKKDAKVQTTSLYTYGFEASLPAGWTTYESAVGGTNGRITTSTPNSGTYHWAMASTTSSMYKLNELIYHYTGTECNQVTFYSKDAGDEQEIMSSSFSGHENSDGVAISSDNTNWQLLWQAPLSFGTYSQYIFDISSFGLGTDFYIKFQQYDNYELGTDGIMWDDIGFNNIQVIPSNDNNIRNSTFNLNLDSGISINSGNGDIITGCKFYDNLDHGVDIQDLSNIQIKDSWFYANVDNGVYISNSNKITIQNCTVSNSGLSGIYSPPSMFQGFESALPGTWATWSSTGSGRNQRTNAYSPNTGSYEWMMDTTTVGLNLNELVYHHTGFSASTLTFYARETGEEVHTMPNSFSGTDYSDGIAVSTDNVNWQAAWQTPSSFSTYSKYSVDLTPFSLGSDFYIKFQQYDDNPTGTDGIFWDDISVGNYCKCFFKYDDGKTSCLISFFGGGYDKLIIICLVFWGCYCYIGHGTGCSIGFILCTYG